jgi:hypothetical protein
MFNQVSHESSLSSPGNTDDPDKSHRFTDELGRHWHRHMNGALYCSGTRVLQILDSKIVQVTATDWEMIVTAGKLHREWNVGL